ncbi:MAG: hypothetical protein FJX16_03345, partial [Alphaproteobacteria bacterium]|nr:hypothetical protein [Alphaproteobacteria bacterium]
MRLLTRSRARLFSTVALAAGAAATLGYSGSPAMAQGFFFWGGDSAPRAAPPRDIKRVARPQRNVGGKKASLPAAEKTGATTAREAKAEAPQFDRPLFLIASIADQHVSIYNHHGLVVRSAISTGIPGHPTPRGIFSIIGRERFHRSNIYSSAPMPFMQRITWSGIAMHLGVVPGHPASHGCIRLPAAFAAKLWGMTRIGERVVISPHELTPAEFDHALLPQPKMLPSVEADKSASVTVVAADRASVAPQRQEAKADAGSEAGDAAKGGPVADAQPQAAAAKPESPAEQQKVEAPDAAKGVPAADSQQKAPIVADAPAAKPEPPAEQQKAQVAEPAEAAKATAAADLQPATPVVAAAPAANPQQQAEQPKIDAGADKARPLAGSPSSAGAERLTLNPQQYARQLKTKASADFAAATSAVKALTAEVAAKQREATRAAAEFRAAEAGQAGARTRADAAAASYDAATASAAGQREPAETAERVALAGDAPAKAKADGLTRAYGKALLAQDAALLAKTNADSVLADATAKFEQARAASAVRDSELADADRRLDEARTSAAA